ncbi:hypothetical protein [Streptomyces sp. NPDC060184]|uniref:hypothetical protein n=1 Tax=Streptomyces sp. NPDC060184 TaxID=3347064 RepID=UPI00364A4BA3
MQVEVSFPTDGPALELTEQGEGLLNSYRALLGLAAILCCYERLIRPAMWDTV